MIKKLSIHKILFLFVFILAKGAWGLDKATIDAIHQGGHTDTVIDTYAPVHEEIKALGLDEATIDAIHQGGHTYTVIDTYAPVHEEIKALLANGGRGHKIFLLTDWDDVVVGSPKATATDQPKSGGIKRRGGAWLQKCYDGKYIHPKSKRMLLEHEVDDNLRDPNLPDILKDIKSKAVPVIVITARPPIIDTKIPEMAGKEHANLLDVRHPDNPDLIHYEHIAEVVTRTINGKEDKELIRLAREKVAKMEKMSGISLKGQAGLNTSVITVLDKDDPKKRHMVYHDGYAFVAHDKGPYAYELIKLMDEGVFPEHLLIVDDGTRAMNSYAKVLAWFRAKGTTVHLFHYPIPTPPTGTLA